MGSIAYDTTRKMEIEIILEKISDSGKKIALPDEALDIVKLSGIDVP